MTAGNLKELRVLKKRNLKNEKKKKNFQKFILFKKNF
jgi:hypothetical protein